MCHGVQPHGVLADSRRRPRPRARAESIISKHLMKCSATVLRAARLALYNLSSGCKAVRRPGGASGAQCPVYR